MRYIFCLWAMLCLSVSNAQPHRPLSIGDSVPDLALHHILNAPFSESSLNNFKDRVLILDFFATWCSPCVAMLPRLDSLQKSMGDTLQVLVITDEKPAVVNRFLNRTKRIHLPIITSDTLLKKWFPHKLLPHEVWISRGRVAVISHPESINAGNIRQLATSGILSVPVKSDLFQFNRNKPIMENQVIQQQARSLYASRLLAHIPGLAGMSGISWDTVHAQQRRYFINVSLTTLYKQAIGNRIPLNRWILNIRNREAFEKPAAETILWRNNNTYCYEQSAPMNTAQEKLNSRMLADLDQQFNWNSAIETRKTACFVVRSPKPEPIDSGRHQEDILVSDLIKRMNLERIGAPVYIDSTHAKQWIPKPETSITNDDVLLCKYLQGHGFSITGEELSLPFFVLTDISSSFKPHL